MSKLAFILGAATLAAFIVISCTGSSGLYGGYEGVDASGDNCAERLELCTETANALEDELDQCKQDLTYCRDELAFCYKDCDRYTEDLQDALEECMSQLEDKERCPPYLCPVCPICPECAECPELGTNCFCGPCELEQQCHCHCDRGNHGNRNE